MQALSGYGTPVASSVLCSDSQQVTKRHRIFISRFLDISCLRQALQLPCADRTQRSSTKGLPCELSHEELSLAVRRGWVILNAASRGREDVSSGSLVHLVPDAGLAGTGQPQTAQPAWVIALQTKVPVRVLRSRSESANVAGDGHQTVPGTSSLAASTCTAYSSVDQDSEPCQDKFRVYSDLHDRGYYITGGAKFGADYLLYPGDPHLFHAQFTVRIMQGQGSLKAALLAGNARGSHAARKHLLLAWVLHGKVTYITVAPEGGFGPME